MNTPCVTCAGEGVYTDMVPDCCGNPYPGGECRGHCAVPRPVQIACPDCGGAGFHPVNESSLVTAAAAPLPVKVLRNVAFGLCALVASCAAPQVPLSIDSAGQVVPPYGYVGFCVRNPDECGGGTDAPQLAEITPAKWAELVAVNDQVNRLPQVSDAARFDRSEWWELADETGGDCEDLAMAKRRLLIERGWPLDALLIAVVREWNGDGHAVLLVVSYQGQFVLDNKSPTVERVADAPYQWVKVQSPRRPFVWLSADGKRAPAYPPLGEPAPFLVAVGVTQ